MKVSGGRRLLKRSANWNFIHEPFLARMRTTQCEPHRLQFRLASDAGLMQDNTNASGHNLTNDGQETFLCNGVKNASKLGR